MSCKYYDNFVGRYLTFGFYFDLLAVSTLELVVIMFWGKSSNEAFPAKIYEGLAHYV